MDSAAKVDAEDEQAEAEARDAARMARIAERAEERAAERAAKATKRQHLQPGEEEKGDNEGEAEEDPLARKPSFLSKEQREKLALERLAARRVSESAALGSAQRKPTPAAAPPVHQCPRLMALPLSNALV